jgi:DNA-binding MarR family transcriptional regulator
MQLFWVTIAAMASLSVDVLSDRQLNAWRGMLAAHSAIIATLDEELEREHGLPLTSYEVLLHLADAPDRSLRMGDLAERLFLSRSGLTRLIDRLVKAGLVERASCESDRRGSYARLTAEGRRRFDAARPTHLRGVREHFLRKLDDRDQDRLAEIWAKVLGRPL